MVKSTDEPSSKDDSALSAVDAPMTPSDGVDRLADVLSRGRDAFPTTRIVHGLFGRRTSVSVGIVALAAALAVGAAQHVFATVGYETLESWVYGTWTGTNPEPLVFLGVAALLALAVASAAVNAGLVPTTALVAAPVYGIAFTRYGTSETFSRFGPDVVSLPEAAAFAAFAALLAAVPIAVVGFAVGVALRRDLPLPGPTEE
ncbi:hypothetical protein [Halorubellus salinus]|uniref:hypothetical protein n=1 Tax=Halorubellus salinus TaxID=755309 RepID=UPI001D06036A|nr:hypothetical protein [Halorubellus salinus]